MNKLQKKDHLENINIATNKNINIESKNNLTKKISHNNQENITELNTKEIIFDIPVNITIELGRAKIQIKELLNFSKGSMLFLNHKQEDPLKIFANDKLIAFGEIVVSDNTYGVKIISIKNSENNN